MLESLSGEPEISEKALKEKWKKRLLDIYNNVRYDSLAEKGGESEESLVAHNASKLRTNWFQGFFFVMEYSLELFPNETIDELFVDLLNKFEKKGEDRMNHDDQLKEFTREEIQQAGGIPLGITESGEKQNFSYLYNFQSEIDMANSLLIQMVKHLDPDFRFPSE
jgi:hypothetical protein